MNLTILKFNQKRSCSEQKRGVLLGRLVTVAGLAWILIGVFIPQVQAFEVSEVLQVINNPIDPPVEAREVVAQVSKELKPQIQGDDSFAQQLGFLDARELTEVTPYSQSIQDQPQGPVPVLYVSLKALKNFDLLESSTAVSVKEDYAISLITENANWSNLSKSILPRRFLYPVTNANDRVISSILVGFGLRDKEWKTLKIGLPGLTQALANPKLRTPGLNYFAINIRSLNRWYLGWISGGEFWLKAVVKDKGINYSKGESHRAGEVFAALKTEAMEIDRFDPRPR